MKYDRADLNEVNVKSEKIRKISVIPNIELETYKNNHKENSFLSDSLNQLSNHSYDILFFDDEEEMR